MTGPSRFGAHDYTDKSGSGFSQILRVLRLLPGVPISAVSDPRLLSVSQKHPIHVFLDNLLLPGAAREGSRRLPAAVTVPTVSRGARTQEREEGDHKPEHGGRHNKDCRDEVGGLHRAQAARSSSWWS